MAGPSLIRSGGTHVTSSNTSVSKPLIVTLVVVALLAVAYFIYSKSQNASANEDNIPGIVKQPPGMKPLTPEEKARMPGPHPAGGG